ncbi:MAG TPA: DUF1232 domain-containing protein [Verrucomicrobiae bacterium]|nr:DUF1232 domain-containing protein [Verrucomicrobiae bacterium]
MKDELKAYFARFVDKASESDIPKIAQNLAAMCRGPIQKTWGDVQALWSMVKDPTAAWKSKTIAIGALLYLVSPIDLIPDAIPVLGLTDDASVIAAAVASLSIELKKYRVQVLGEAPAPNTQPPPVPPAQPQQLADNSVELRLKTLNGLLESKIISQAEYDAKRQQILSEL